MPVLWIRFRIRIRINMFLGILDPDPGVRGMDPDPALDPESGSFYHHAKTVRKTLIS
jgi:hypothetical protein